LPTLTPGGPAKSTRKLGLRPLTATSVIDRVSIEEIEGELRLVVDGRDVVVVEGMGIGDEPNVRRDDVPLRAVSLRDESPGNADTRGGGPDCTRVSTRDGDSSAGCGSWTGMVGIRFSTDRVPEASDCDSLAGVGSNASAPVSVGVARGESTIGARPGVADDSVGIGTAPAGGCISAGP
jgi:hypothetical protein